MSVVYLDTSALGRVLLGEPDARAIVRDLARFEEHVSSRLLGVELRRLAQRHERLGDAERLLSAVALLPVEETLLAAAETVAPLTVGTLDAIHLATALRLAYGRILDAVMTYDARLAVGAREYGLAVLRPE